MEGAYGVIRLMSVELPEPGEEGLLRVISTRAQFSPLKPHSPEMSIKMCDSGLAAGGTDLSADS